MESKQGPIELYLLHHSGDIKPNNGQRQPCDTGPSGPSGQDTLTHAGAAHLPALPSPSLAASPLTVHAPRGTHPLSFMSPGTAMASHLMSGHPHSVSSMHLPTFSPGLKPEPFTPPALKNDLGFAGEPRQTHGWGEGKLRRMPMPWDLAEPLIRLLQVAAREARQIMCRAPPPCSYTVV